MNDSWLIAPQVTGETAREGGREREMELGLAVLVQLRFAISRPIWIIFLCYEERISLLFWDYKLKNHEIV